MSSWKKIRVRDVGSSSSESNSRSKGQFWSDKWKGGDDDVPEFAASSEEMG